MFWFALALLFGKQILSFYMQDIVVIENGLKYLQIVMFSYVFLAIEFAFNIIYRNINKPHIPLLVGITSMIINIIVNYLLIFGAFGFPQLGIRGAAFGTCAAHVFAVIFHLFMPIKQSKFLWGIYIQFFLLISSLLEVIMKKNFFNYV